MRDVIWTLIVIWLVYRLVDVFRTKSKPANPSQTNEDSRASQNSSFPPTETKIKKAFQDHLNKEGEYIDFEEIK